MPPDPDSAKAAVEALTHELDMAANALENTDRKAALVPAALGAIAGLFIAPNSTFSAAASAMLIGAFVGAMIAGYHALQAMRAQRFRIGPDADTMADSVHLDPAHFNWGVATAIAKSIAVNQEIAIWKGRHLNLSLFAAYATILLLAVARIMG